MQFLSTNPISIHQKQPPKTSYFAGMSQGWIFRLTFLITIHSTEPSHRPQDSRGSVREEKWAAPDTGATAEQEEDRERVIVAGWLLGMPSGEAQHRLFKLQKKCQGEIGNRSGRKTTAPKSCRTSKPRRGLKSRSQGKTKRAAADTEVEKPRLSGRRGSPPRPSGALVAPTPSAG